MQYVRIGLFVVVILYPSHQRDYYLWLTVTAISQLAELAVQLAARTGSSKNWGSVGLYTACSGALDCDRPGIAG